MIICICRRLNETAVREAVRKGASTPDAVQAFHGCQFNCGKCRPAMDEIVSCETVASAPVRPWLQQNSVCKCTCFALR